MFKNFKWFLKYSKKNYIIGSISLIITDIISLFLPYLTGKLIDMVYLGTLTMDTFIKMIVIALIMVILKYVTAIAWSYNIFKSSSLMEYVTRDKLMSKFLKQSQRFFEQNSTGSLMSKSTQDVGQVAMFAGFGILAFFDALVFPIFILLMMVTTIDFRLTIFSILPMLVFLIAYSKLVGKWYIRSKAVNESFDDLTNRVLEDVEGIRIVRVFNIGDIRYNNFKESARELADKSIDLARLQSWMEPSERFTVTLAYIISIGYGSVLISRGDLSVGQVVSFTYYLNMLIWPMFAFGEFMNLNQQANAAMDRIMEVLNYKEEIPNSESLENVDNNPSISFIEHNFTYPSNNEKVLKDINLRIDQGSSLGIIGKTGSGKTSLIRQLLDIYKVDKESIIISDDSFSEISSKSFKDKIGYVPQEHMIFSDTLKNNIRFSKLDASDEEIDEAISIADFTKDIKKFSDGLDTLTGEKGVSLSGGQKQRLAIARAVLKDPDILILDDAMSAVDANTEQNIIKNLSTSRKDKTTIIIAHRISQVQNCDNIIILEDGKIVDSGNHDELMSRETWYKDQYIKQISGGNNG
ncbi:ABC transporter ATP-binding protein [Anaerococcus sp. Marseille-Q7828]|uniref:ABC transporter ATP-binding protein n=1 Tax=Anaerococcus sp. Marseille-Q7828 TaxID=3036300 RepID=UPI0024AC9A30|nr:ABC transporter ATP-binding protein [Anaerococcus sp. Marseille-Q7828]